MSPPRPVVLTADEAGVREAARALEGGALVAFPTETVYGLGAVATDERHVARVFEAKGRPASNPVIVHVLGLDEAAALSSSMPEAAVTLARRFWPGPLSLVLPRGPSIPDIVAARGPTVAIRAPSHPVARALLAELKRPVAAPSANRSTEVSPSEAAHVVASLGDRVDVVLDGGRCDVGIESTVVDVASDDIVVLRPGSVGRDEIERVLGRPVALASSTEGPLRSPGLMLKHYAPRVPCRLVERGEIDALMTAHSVRGARVAVLSLGRSPYPGVVLPADPAGYARGLYAALRYLEQTCDLLLIERVPDEARFEAVRDRIERASRAG